MFCDEGNIFACRYQSVKGHTCTLTWILRYNKAKLAKLGKPVLTATDEFVGSALQAEAIQHILHRQEHQVVQTGLEHGASKVRLHPLSKYG